MKPYYEADGITLYHGDCRAVLPTLEAGSVDLVLTDPPYFRMKDEWWDRQWDTAAGFLEWLGRLCKEWQRVLKPNGSVYVFASPQMAAHVELEVGRWFNVLNRITWRKDDGWAKRQCKEEQRAFFPASEAIVFAEQYGDQYEDAAQALHKKVYAPIGRAVQVKRLGAGLERYQVDSACSPSRKPTGLCYRWEEGACLPTLEQWVDLCRLCGDRREYEALRQEYEALRQEYEALRRPFAVSANVPCTDVWEFATVNDYPGKHPCEKPVGMLEHMILASTVSGAVVLDCCAGSGSTLDAARHCERKAVGVEIEERWCKRTARRLEQGVLAFEGD